MPEASVRSKGGMRVWTAVATGLIFAIATGGPTHDGKASDGGKAAGGTHDGKPTGRGNGGKAAGGARHAGRAGGSAHGGGTAAAADPSGNRRPVAKLDPDDLVSQVTRATQRARYTRFSITMRPRGGGSPSAGVTGAYRFTRPYGADVAATITAPDRSGTDRRTRFVAAGRYLYLRPWDRSRLPAGKAWVRFRRDDDVAATRYVRPLVLEIARALDAVRDWRMFASAAHLRKAGTLTDGTRETGYHAAIDVPRALRGTTDGTHAMLVDIANRDVDRIGYTVWLNEKTRLPVQVQVSMTYRSQPVDITAHYQAWAEQAPIPVPPHGILATP